MDSIQKVLIPTDFSIASLNLVKEAAEQSTSDKMDIILVYGVHLSTSIHELIFFSKNKVVAQLQSSEFNDACSLLKNKYRSKIRSIHPELLISNNRNYIEQFLEHEKIDQIFIPTYYKLKVNSRKYFDPTPLLSKVTSTSSSLNWPGSSTIPFPITNHLSDLFLPG